MWDEKPIGCHINSPAIFRARFAGNGANPPNPVANVKDSQSTQCTVTRTGVGVYTLTPKDIPLGVVQFYDFCVATNTALNKQCLVTPPAVANYTFTVTIVHGINNTAIDLAIGEELVVDIWFARTQVP